PEKHQGEQHRGRAVVEQALGLDEEPEPPAHSRLAKKRDHRDGVGGGDERSERERRHHGPGQKLNKSPGDKRGGKNDADGRKRKDWDEFALELLPAQVERRLEKQRRQHDVEDEVVRVLQSRLDAKARQGPARHDEGDRVGQPQTSRRERNEDGEAEQADRANDEFTHPALFSGGSEEGKSRPYSADVNGSPARIKRSGSTGSPSMRTS